MIFTRSRARAILRGAKTEIRLKRQPDQERPYFKVGGSYVIQFEIDRYDEHAGEVRTQRETLGHFLVSEIREQNLQDVTDADARAEGYDSAEDFFTMWRQKYGEGPLYMDPIPMWVLTVSADPEEKALFLAKGSTSNYTQDPRQALGAKSGKGGVELRDVEPQVLDPVTLAEYAEKGRQRFNDTHKQEVTRRKHQSVVQRLRAATIAAERKGIDAGPEIESLEKQLDKLERKLGEAA